MSSQNLMDRTEGRRVSFSRLGDLARRTDSVITRLMADKLARPQILSLAAGFTDNRVLPEALVRSAVDALAEEGTRAHLQYGMNRGRPGLRSGVLDLLANYPGEADAGLDEENVLITNGSQQGLYILVQMLCDPGDIVLVESPTYFVFLELLAGMGVSAVSLPMDEAGHIDAGGVRALLETMKREGRRSRVKLVYLMGAFGNPSTRCISEPEKVSLLEVLRAQDRVIPVIEDMAYRELYFDTPYPARSLLALERSGDYPIIYAGTFTKPFATGLKVGFLVSRHKECLAAIATIKGHQDFGTAHFNQAILERVLQGGFYQQHLAEIREHYRHKRDLLESALMENGLEQAGWHWRQPSGGLLLWVNGPEGLDSRMGSKFHQTCLENEILYVPGDLCFAEGRPYSKVRLSFGALESELIPEAARRFCQAALP